MINAVFAEKSGTGAFLIVPIKSFHLCGVITSGARFLFNFVVLRPFFIPP